MPHSNTPGLESLCDLCTPWCLHVAVTLRLAELMDSGIQSVDDLATNTNSDPYFLRCVLRHLISKGVFEEPEAGQFALNPAARQLMEPGWRLMLDLNGIGGRMAGAWGTLPQAVRTGRPAYEELFGRPFWDDLAANPAVAASFDDLMGIVGHGKPDTEVLLDGDWRNIQTVLDVGGGTGVLLTGILLQYPHLTGILVELSRAVESATNTFTSAGLTDRVTIAQQSFFDELPAGAGLYILKSILNDWPDEDAVKILRRCAEAAGGAGRIAIIGGVTDEARPIGMTPELVLVGGRSRTIEEFGDLVRKAGLRIHATGHQPSGRFMVECRAI